MQLKSPQFADGQALPIQYTADASDFAPALEWDDAPEGTRSFALLCEDQDGPHGPWTHWLVYGIPGAAFMLAPKLARMAEHPSGLRQGLNDWGRLGYSGPAPGHGSGRYVFTVYALDTDPDLPPRAGRKDFDAALQGHVLASASTVATYGAP
jgi:hypothetical protein